MSGRALATSVAKYLVADVLRVDWIGWWTIALYATLFATILSGCSLPSTR